MQSRLFWEDIPYGLCVLKSVAKMLDVPTPTMDKMIRWHQQFMGKTYLTSDGILNPDLVKKTVRFKVFMKPESSAFVYDDLGGPRSI